MQAQAVVDRAIGEDAKQHEEDGKEADQENKLPAKLAFALRGVEPLASTLVHANHHRVRASSRQRD